ncbi:protein of unknown function [Belliella buryatensis]|uniref:DUF4382 domain-containing protein n=1 Tax=Belliella buryatensis TaxID=1500549 RepID=A0A239BME7_9BACT|nr:DUF4382 domain-containing protein [Belliella buryatensis]SNS08214.1 protein of unknown function [Belliella buryatensis]
MKKYFIITLFVSSLFSCATEEERSNSLINIFLVDAPADVDALWVELLGVDVEVESEAGSTSPFSKFLEYESGIKMVDIAQLVGNQELLIGRGIVPSGRLSKMRLSLGNDNYVIKNDVRTNLNLSTPNESGLNINVDFSLRPGISHDIYIDFDLLKSLIQNGPRDFTFRPSLRGFSKAATGEISGSLRPGTERAFLYAIQQNDTITTGVNVRANGEFVFRGLEGTYTIFIIPKNTEYLPDTIRTVIVQSQQRTQLGNITLRPRQEP